MDALKQGYQDIMSMPVGRRKRICEEHSNLLAWRKAKQDKENPPTGRGPKTRR
jgi:hypothetical protein